jgi:uncharacterized protein (TIGR02231 family)
LALFCSNVNPENFSWFHVRVTSPPQIRHGFILQTAIGIGNDRRYFMRLYLAGVLLATTCCTSAFAAEFSPTSHIDAVTVYPQGADVVREVEIEIPAGEHSLVLKDVPQNIDPQTIRVEGASSGDLLVGSVDTRNKFQGEADAGPRRALEKQIQDFQFERQALDLTISDLNQQRSILLNLADKQLVPPSTTDNVKVIDATQLGGLLDLVGQKLSSLSSSVLTAQKRQREIDERTAALSAELNELAPVEEYRTEVVVNVDAKVALKGALRVSYRVQEASWMPFYDACLTIGDGKSKPALELVHRADVTQNTGESWKNVELTLSTARPNGATAAPQLPSWEVSKVEVAEPLAQAAPAMAEADMALEDKADSEGGAKTRNLRMAKPKAIMQKQATIEIAGFQANYVIAGRVSVDNAGQSKKVRITSGQMDAELSVITVPRMDVTAYLTATFKVAGAGPQLPGIVNLFRDGTYVGQGSLPLLNPTEEAKLGFGADDLIKVTRNEVKRVAGEEGFLTSSNVDERAWDITVKNLHDIAIPVRVVDRVPFTASKEIEISEMPGMTPATVRDLDKQRGVLAWDFALEPQAENSLKTGYKISWPEGMRVSVVE